MNIVSSPTTHTGTTITLPTGGATYVFDFSAVNVHGSGAYSTPSISVKASSVPDQISTVVISEYTTNSTVRITWNVPNDNFETISSYKVYLLQKSTGLYKIFTWICDGAQGTDGSGDKYCDVQMSKFITDLGYSIGQ